MRALFRSVALLSGGIGLVALVLLAFEVTVRLDDWARFDVPPDNGATSLDDLLVHDALGQHARPSAVYKQFRINARGFRGEDIPDSILARRKIVFTSGASETFGLYETKDREWPRQMADSLRQRCSGAAITVLNAAFAGMSLPTVIQDVHLRLLPLRPAAIIFYPTPSQYLFRRIPQATPPELASPRRLTAWNLRAPARLRDALRRAIPQPLMELLRRADTRRARASGETPFAQVPVERLDTMEAQLRTLVGEIRNGGAQAVLMVPANRFGDTSSVAERRILRSWERLTPKATGEILLRFGELANDRIRKVATDSGVPLVDATRSLRRESSSSFADFSHFTDRGAAVVGGAAAAQLASLLHCEPPR